MKQLNTTDVAQTLRHLMTRYGIEIDTGWKETEVAILDRNVAILNDPVALSAKYPMSTSLDWQDRPGFEPEAQVGKGKALVRAASDARPSHVLYVVA